MTVGQRSIPARAGHAATLLAFGFAIAIAGCGGAVDPGGDVGGGAGGGSANATARGAVLFARQCAICHGKDGTGITAPPLRSETRSRAELIAYIGATMPKGDPGRCDARCGADVADYILAYFSAAPLQCSKPDLASPRRLRLLTRREYLATVSDLLVPTAGPPPPCDRHTFSFDPKGRVLKSVHVAGSFNGWPATIAGGGWAMTFDGTKGQWTLDHPLAPGTWAYKFVLNESEWVPDPTDPVGTPDGFGGMNSVLVLQCTNTGSRLGYDPTTGFPLDSRPDRFAFDDNAEARVVTPVHVSEYLAAGEKLGKTAAANLATLLPGCDFAGNRAGCTDRFVRAFGRRAFRRPLTDGEVARYSSLFASSPAVADGASLCVQALLSSPNFLYRSEIGVAGADGRAQLTAWEAASALSYLFWGTMPDDALLDAAGQGALDTPAGMEVQARRLLSDPRSRDQIGVFALEWLGVEQVVSANKSAAAFPGFSDEVKQKLADETRRFVEAAVFDEGGGFDQVFTADFSFLDGTLGAFYGVPNASGDWKKTALGDGTRAGVLGHGSVLATYAYPDQGSPIRRGLFVRRNLLCQEFPPPVANAGAVPQVNPGSTTRERFKQHTKDPSCSTCHQYIDPVGFSFERFDAVGRYRTSEGGMPVDSTADLVDVEELGSATHAPLSSLPELGKALAASDGAHDCFVRQYYRFAHGALDTTDDLCALAAVKQKFQTSGWSVRELMLAVALSPDFVSRR